MKRRKLAKVFSLILTASLFLTSIPVGATEVAVSENGISTEVVVTEDVESVSAETEMVDVESTDVEVSETSDAEETTDIEVTETSDGTLITYDVNTSNYERKMPNTSDIEKITGDAVNEQGLEIIEEDVDVAETDWESFPDINEEYRETEDIATLNYKEIADEQLANIIDNTSFTELGKWLSSMSESELNALLERDTPLNQEAQFIDVSEDATDEEIERAIPYTELYYKYAMKVYGDNAHQKKITYFYDKTACYYVHFVDKGTGKTGKQTVKISNINTTKSLEKSQKVTITITKGGNTDVLTKFGVVPDSKTNRYTYAKGTGKAKKYLPTKWSFNKTKGYIVTTKMQDKISKSGSLVLFTNNKALDTDKKYLKISGEKLNANKVPNWSHRESWQGNATSLGYPNLNDYASEGKVKFTLFTNIAKDGGAKLKQGSSASNAKLVGKKTAYSNMTYIFNFRPMTYNVIFDKGGATTGASSQLNKVSYDATITIPSNIKREYVLTYDYNDETRANYSVSKSAMVKEWNVKSHCASLTDKPKLSPSSIQTKNLTTKPNATVEYSPTFDSGSLTVTLITPTRTGYIFDGWFDKKDGGNKVSSGGTTLTLTNDITLYAHWTPIKYNVEYKAMKYNEEDGTFNWATLDTVTDNEYDKEYNLKSVLNFTYDGSNLFKEVNDEDDGIIFRYNGSDTTVGSEVHCRWNNFNYAENHYGYRGTSFKAWCTKSDLSDETYENAKPYKNLTSQNGATVTLYLKVVPAKSSVYIEDWRQRKIENNEIGKIGDYSTEANYYVHHIERFRRLTGDVYEHPMPNKTIERQYYHESGNPSNEKAKDALGQNIFSDEDEILATDWNSYELKAVYTNGIGNANGLVNHNGAYESVSLEATTIPVIVRANNSTLQNYIDARLGLSTDNMVEEPTVIRFYWSMRDYRTTATVIRKYQLEDGTYKAFEDGDFDWESKGFKKTYKDAVYSNPIIEGWAGYNLVAGEKDQTERNRVKSNSTYQEPSSNDDFARAYAHEDDEWTYTLVPEVVIESIDEEGNVTEKKPSDISYSEAVLELDADANKTITIDYRLIKKHKSVNYAEYHMYEVGAEEYNAMSSAGGNCLEKDGRYYILGYAETSRSAEYGDVITTNLMEDVKNKIRESSMLYFDANARKTSKENAVYSGSQYVYSPCIVVENGVEKELNTATYTIDDEVASTGIAYVLYDRADNEVAVVVNDYLQKSPKVDSYELLGTRKETIPFGQTITVYADESLIAQSNEANPNNVTKAQTEQITLLALNEIYMVTDISANEKSASADTSDNDGTAVDDNYSVAQSDNVTDDELDELEGLNIDVKLSGTKAGTNLGTLVDADGVQFAPVGNGNAVNMYYTLEDREAVVTVKHYYKSNVNAEEYEIKDGTIDVAFNTPIDLLENKDDGEGKLVYTYADNDIIASMNAVEGYKCIVKTDEQNIVFDSTNVGNTICFYYDFMKTNATFTVEHLIPTSVDGHPNYVAKKETRSGVVGTKVLINPLDEVINLLDGKFEGYKAIRPTAVEFTVVNGGTVQVKYFIEKDDEYDDGKDDGEEDGKDDGEEDGKDDGEEDGKDDGEEDGKDDGEEDGKDDGEEDGKDDGEKDGEDSSDNSNPNAPSNPSGNGGGNNSGTTSTVIIKLPNGTNVTLTETQVKAFIDALNSGSSAKLTVDGVEYTIVKNADGSLSVKVVSLKDNQTKASVPSEVTIGGKTYPITSIENGAFKNNEKLTEVVIPSSVTKIGDSSFENCKNLKKVSLGEGLVTIGSKAFKNCTAITSITLPKSLKEIGSSAFEGCKALTKITIPKNVLTIGSKAFKNCSKLKTVKFASGSKLLKMGSEVFYNCKKLTKITLPSSLTSIPKKAFKNCSVLASVKGGKSVTSIGNNAFENCKKLKAITITSKVQTIGSKAFYNCKVLKKVTIKTKALTKVGSKAFKKCKKGIKFYIPKAKESSYKKLLKGKY